MPSNWFEVKYYALNQKRGRPHVKLFHKASPEIDEEFKQWVLFHLPYGSKLRSVELFLPSFGKRTQVRR